MFIYLWKKASTYWEFLVKLANEFKHGSEMHPAQLLEISTILSIPLTILTYFFFPFSHNFQQNLLIITTRVISLASFSIAYYLSRTPKYYLGSYFFILGGVFVRIYYALFVQSDVSSQLIVVCIVAAAFLLKTKEAVLVSIFLITVTAVTLYFLYDHTVVQLGFYLFSSLTLLIVLTLFNIRNNNHVHKIHKQAQQLVVKEAEKQQHLFQQFQAEFHTNAITSISHDLKTPLTIIKLKSSILEIKFREQASKYTQSTSEAVDRISFLISEMSQFEKYGQVAKETWKTIDINEIVKKQADAISEKFALTNPLQLDLSSDPLFCLGDESKLAISIKELLENAYLHSGQDADIFVHTTSKNGYNSLTITDTGPGIPANQSPKIFDYYFKGDQARSSWKTGSGLGLPLVKMIVTQHGGKISITSEENKGTSVELLLPRMSPTTQ